MVFTAGKALSKIVQGLSFGAGLEQAAERGPRGSLLQEIAPDLGFTLHFSVPQQPGSSALDVFNHVMEMSQS